MGDSISDPPSVRPLVSSLQTHGNLELIIIIIPYCCCTERLLRMLPAGNIVGALYHKL